MLSQFKRDFWLLSREAKGYYAWARNPHASPHRDIGRNWGHHGMCCDIEDSQRRVEALFEYGLGFHPLLDIAFEAFARAETRFALRFIPQQSNEERLTGHLISELEAAIHLVADSFAAKSIERYGESRQIDFAYYDLSQGGHVEKNTGGDLALILSVDLPDRPKLISYAAIQAKRLSPSSAQLDKDQFDTLTHNFGNAAAYLFYDCDLNTLAPPMIISAGWLKGKRDEKEAKSFALSQRYVFHDALPLSLWLITELSTGKAGATKSDFLSALELFRSTERKDPKNNGKSSVSRLAMISIGRPFDISRDVERGLKITL